MKILLLSNQTPDANGVGNPIMSRLRNAMEQDERVECAHFMPTRNSFASLKEVRRAAKRYDIAHIHFGGMYALAIRLALIGTKCKKYITFHGTDIHAKAIRTSKSMLEKLKIWLNQKSSFLSICLFDRCGFVSADLMGYVPSSLFKMMKYKTFVQRLGVDYELFVESDKVSAQKKLGIIPGRYILFSDVSHTSIKRRDIAESIVRELGNGYRLLVMTGVKPTEVPDYINACEFALLTSDEEGSPNIIREVLALNKPFFSVEVGDAESQLAGLANSAIISRDAKVAAQQIREVMNKEYTDNTRYLQKDMLDFTMINRSVVDLYQIDLRKS